MEKVQRKKYVLFIFKSLLYLIILLFILKMLREKRIWCDTFKSDEYSFTFIGAQKLLNAKLIRIAGMLIDTTSALGGKWKDRTWNRNRLQLIAPHTV